jgi:hypothetical protein
MNNSDTSLKHKEDKAKKLRIKSHEGNRTRMFFFSTFIK